MTSDSQLTEHMRFGSAGGILIVLAQIDWSDLLETILLATTGTVVSLLVSVCLKYLIRQWTKRS